ncbi:MAG: hypothetical protein RSD49_08065 [Hafnia sp.]
MLEQYVVEEADKYHRVMECLRNMGREHGKCHPREDRACTHCNAAEELQTMIDEYPGRRLVAS